MVKLNFYLIRHGLTDWNLVARAQGREDIDLNEDGRRQAEYCAKALAKLPLDCIVSSPLLRAVHTAEMIAKYHPGLAIQVMQEFIERDYGKLSGLFPEEAKQFRNSGKNPCSEDKQAVAERAFKGLELLCETCDGENVLIVTHGGVIGAILKELIGGRSANSHLNNVYVNYIKGENGSYKVIQYNIAPEVFVQMNT